MKGIGMHRRSFIATLATTIGMIVVAPADKATGLTAGQQQTLEAFLLSTIPPSTQSASLQW